MNKSLAEFNEKSELIRLRTQSLREQKNTFKLEKIEPEVELKYAKNESKIKNLKIKIEQLENKIDEIDTEIERVKMECELEIAHRHKAIN